MLAELRTELPVKNIVFTMAKVKQDLYLDLKRAGCLENLKAEHIYPTLNTAIAVCEQRKDI